MRKRQQYRHRRLLDFIEGFFRRTIALVLLAHALAYWLRIVGLTDDSAMRFDLMPDHWRAASAVLAVILPVAAVGLWGMFPWGTITWFACAIIEVTIYVAYSDLFGNNHLVVVFYIISVTLYFLIKLAHIIAYRASHSGQPSSSSTRQMAS